MPTLILPWFEQGHLRNYFQGYNTEIDASQRTRWVGPIPFFYLDHSERLSQISEVSDGLAYLHKMGVIHGGLRGVRICADAKTDSNFDNLSCLLGESPFV